MVKRSRLQSGEVAEPAHLADDGAARLRLPLPDLGDEASRPSSRRPWLLPEAASWRSTTICVAMPAWSVPGCQSTSWPRMRWNRTSVSWMVWSSAWPMCRLPVTLGGGSMMQ